MNYLLDTHVIVWLATKRRRIRKATVSLFEDPANTLWISAVSVWEIGIKTRLGKLRMPEDWLSRTDEWEARELSISSKHAARASGLPELHDDPFDRMLIAQALCESMTLVTDDEFIHQYEVTYLEP